MVLDLTKLKLITSKVLQVDKEDSMERVVESVEIVITDDIDEILERIKQMILIAIEAPDVLKDK